MHPGRGGGKGQTQNRAFWGCFGAVFTPPESLGVFYSGWGLSSCHPAEASRLAVPPGNAQHTLLQLPSLVQVTPKQDFPPSPAPKLDFPPPSPAPEQDFPPSPTKSSSTAFPSSKTPQGGGEELVRHHHEGKRAENRQETGRELVPVGPAAPQDTREHGFGEQDARSDWVLVEDQRLAGRGGLRAPGSRFGVLGRAWGQDFLPGVCYGAPQSCQVGQ